MDIAPALVFALTAGRAAYRLPWTVVDDDKVARWRRSGKGCPSCVGDKERHSHAHLALVPEYAPQWEHGLRAGF